MPLTPLIEKAIEQLKSKSEVINDSLWYVNPEQLRSTLTKVAEEAEERGYVRGQKNAFEVDRKAVAEEVRSRTSPDEITPELMQSIARATDARLSELKREVERLRKKEPKDIYDGEDLFPRINNEALDAVLALIEKKK